MSTPLLLLGDVRRELQADFPNVAEHVVKYAIKSRGIEPVRRFGTMRAWTRQQLPAIRRAIRQTAGK
ncbi:hypothetical protein [Humisphaera borealis]|uniref:Uncharacterized protein n=1 Tax=Humisphaera borealis TaxID=2807512 RepID=A0A7M2X066_9BACT|nr:hypothetical protein [Humisphaera borealis]QOV91063.1 hypothetical protein IPV69_06805 [Humisphaera borealis]